MKLNLPMEETEELVGKVKEKKMGYLFENMEKMDIQEERRKTAEARAELAQAVAEAKEQVAQKAEESIQLQIETCQEVGVCWDVVLQKIQEKNNLSEEETIEKMKLYWKE